MRRQERRPGTSWPRQGAPVRRPLRIASAAVEDDDRPPADPIGSAAMADVLFVVLTLLVFGLLALAARGVERL
jgi:hypothetical protein